MVCMDAKDRKIEQLEQFVAKQAATIERMAQRIDELERKLAVAQKKLVQFVEAAGSRERPALRATADHVGGLYERRLPRLVFHHPKVHP
jgi:uncharacterized coiled-coil protein SlyX